MCPLHLCFFFHGFLSRSLFKWPNFLSSRGGFLPLKLEAFFSPSFMPGCDIFPENIFSSDLVLISPHTLTEAASFSSCEYLFPGGLPVKTGSSGKVDLQSGEMALIPVPTLTSYLT